LLSVVVAYSDWYHFKECRLSYKDLSSTRFGRCVHICSVVKIIIFRKEELPRALVKRKEQVEEIKDFERGGLWKKERSKWKK